MSVDNGLRPLFRKNLPEFHWQSIETGGTGRGIPDSNFCKPPPGQRHPVAGTCIEGWIEYKATKAWAVDLRPEQVGWLTQRARYGGRVFIAVRRQHQGGPRLGAAVDELYLFPGGLAVAAVTNGLRDPMIARATLLCTGGPSAWNWRSVAAWLTA